MELTPEERAAMLVDELVDESGPGVAVTDFERAIASAIRQAAAEEREACARAIEGFATEHGGTTCYWGETLAEVIRARP